MKKILILTVTAGNAHNACALGMKREIEKRGGAEVKIVDLLKSYSAKRNAWVADGGYNFAVSKLPKLYNAFYYHYRKAKPYRRYSCPPQKTALSTLDGLVNEIFCYRPDVIYCTHFYAAIALTDLRLVYALPCKVIASSLDYVNSPFWEAGIGVDYLTIPSEEFIGTYRKLGYSRRQLLPVGIPVDGRTLDKTDKAAARRALGLDEKPFTVTVAFGGGSWNGGLKIFKSLLSALKGKRAQVIMLNGKNKKSFRRVQRTKRAAEIEVLNVGFTENVPLYLSASDAVVGKCGGANATEAVNEAVPLLVTEKLPAQEKCNLEYLKAKGVALSFKSKKQLKELVDRLTDETERIARMAQCALPLRKHAAGDLAEFLLALPQADYEGFLDMMLAYGDDLRAKKCVKRALKEADKRERRRARGKG